MGSKSGADELKSKKFQSNIPGTKTSKSGLAYIPSNDAKSQSPTQNKNGAGSKLLMGGSQNEHFHGSSVTNLHAAAKKPMMGASSRKQSPTNLNQSRTSTGGAMYNMDPNNQQKKKVFKFSINQGKSVNTSVQQLGQNSPSRIGQGNFSKP